MDSPQILMLGNTADALAPEALEVDVIADLICPWCYLGKRRLDAALAAVHGPRAVHWYPFQINPDMPQAGMPIDEYLETRFGKRESLQSAMDDLTREGRAEGVNFNFDRLLRVPNTLDAHRLMSLADAEASDPSQLAENILRGYFETGLDLADRDVLVEIADDSGLSRTDVNQALDNDVTRQLVLSKEAQVRRSGITGVPGFLVNKRLYAIGAQSTESLVGIFDRTMFGDESDLPVSPVIH